MGREILAETGNEDNSYQQRFFPKFKSQECPDIWKDEANKVFILPVQGIFDDTEADPWNPSYLSSRPLWELKANLTKVYKNKEHYTFFNRLKKKTSEYTGQGYSRGLSQNQGVNT